MLQITATKQRIAPEGEAPHLCSMGCRSWSPSTAPPAPGIPGSDKKPRGGLASSVEALGAARIYFLPLAAPPRLARPDSLLQVCNLL